MQNMKRDPIRRSTLPRARVRFSSSVLQVLGSSTTGNNATQVERTVHRNNFWDFTLQQLTA
eukprot:1026497-Amorphochlora_amoeboformis.AAC.3